MGGPSSGKETMPSKALKLEALGPLALDIKLVPVDLVSPQGHRPKWRPQGCPFLILAWASPDSQETLPLQQEEFRLHHFPLPAWAAGGDWQADPLTQWCLEVGEGSFPCVGVGVGSHCLGKTNTKDSRAPPLGRGGWFPSS